MYPLDRPVSGISLRSKIREEHLTCTICFCPFTKPKALPCLHTFDEHCLTDYVTSPGRGYDVTGSFPCPVCRKMTPIPEGGISGFPDNHMVMSLTDTVEKSAKGPSVPPRPKLNPTAPQPDFGKSSPVPLYPSVPENPAVDVPPHIPQRRSPHHSLLLLRIGQHGNTIADLQKPYGLAIGNRGEFIISDLAGCRILTYASNGELIGRFSCVDCKISGLTVNRDNNILVAVRGAGSAIARLYNQDGRVLQNVGEFYRYDKPSGIAINSHNQILVSNLEGDNVYILNENGKLSKKFGWKGSGNQHFDSPNFLTVNSKDQIIVSDNGNDCLKMFDNTGEFIRKFGDNLVCPMGVAVDKHNNVIVADAGDFRVQAYTSKGHYIQSVVEDTDLIGPEVKPIDVAITQNNNIAVLLRGTQFAEIRVYDWKTV